MHRFHRPRRSLIAIPLALILITAMSVGYAQHIASAQDDSNASHPGHIHTGTCETPGDIVFPLSNVSAEALVDGSPSAGAAPVGAASAIQPKASQTNVQAALTDIVEGGHTIVVHESDEAIQNYIACGDIGASCSEIRIWSSVWPSSTTPIRPALPGCTTTVMAPPWSRCTSSTSTSSTMAETTMARMRGTMTGTGRGR